MISTASTLIQCVMRTTSGRISVDMGVGRLPRPNLTPLLGLHAGLADDLAPLRILRADEGGELGRRRGRRDLGPDGGHALHDVVLLHALHQDLVHALYLLWSET